MSVTKSMSMSVSKKGNGQENNVHVTMISMFSNMFVLIFMSLNMDMRGEGATARKTIMYNFLSQLAHNKCIKS